MMKRFFLIFGVFALFVSATPGQTTKGKPAQTAPAVSISDLVLQGKNTEAVKLAAKSATALETAWMSLFTSVDTQIVLRALTGAQKNLDAIDAFAKACEKSKQIKNIPSEAIAGRQLRLQGILLSDKGEYDKAAEILKQALERSLKAKDRALEAGVHHNMGFAIEHQGQIKEAEKEYDLARQIAEEIKDNLRAGSSNYNLGMVLFQENNFAAALEAFKRAAEQSRTSAQRNVEALAIMMQGRTAGKQDLKSNASLQLLQDAQGKFEKLGDNLNAGMCYYYMSEFCGYGNDFARAVQYAEKAIPYLEKLDNKSPLQKLYDNLGVMYALLEKKDKSNEYVQRAQELANGSANPEKKIGSAPKTETPVKK
jgi:tetratricopeptide (TPR) repeat protein